MREKKEINVEIGLQVKCAREQFEILSAIIQKFIEAMNMK